MPESALRLEAVGHRFYPGTSNEVRALDRVSLELARASFTVVLVCAGIGYVVAVVAWRLLEASRTPS